MKPYLFQSAVGHAVLVNHQFIFVVVEGVKHLAELRGLALVDGQRVRDLCADLLQQLRRGDEAAYHVQKSRGAAVSRLRVLSVILPCNAKYDTSARSNELRPKSQDIVVPCQVWCRGSVQRNGAAEKLEEGEISTVKWFGWGGGGPC